MSRRDRAGWDPKLPGAGGLAPWLVVLGALALLVVLVAVAVTG